MLRLLASRIKPGAEGGVHGRGIGSEKGLSGRGYVNGGRVASPEPRHPGRLFEIYCTPTVRARAFSRWCVVGAQPSRSAAACARAIKRAASLLGKPFEVLVKKERNEREREEEGVSPEKGAFAEV